MAELDIGQHCSVSNCNQLDFLPFVCTGCSGIFCLDHRTRDGHCCKEDKPTKEYKKVDYVSPTVYSCDLSGCKKTELVPVTCEHCHKNFCLGHRHQADHQCAELPAEKPVPMAETRKLVQQITESRKAAGGGVKKKGKGAKSAKMAAKVALMKMKMSALGDSSIPLSERTYFMVHLPQSSADRQRAMFFSSVWSVGKTVDRIASLLSLKNDNNIGNSQKLRLFHPESGDVFAMDTKLDSLLAADADLPLYSGGGIILEYVSNDCTCLPDVGLYQTS